VRAKERNIVDLSGLPDQWPAKNVYDQFDTAKAYRVTGLVLEVNDRMIAFQRGTNRWEIARDSNTKITGDLKVGATVTITYTMAATEVSTDQGMRDSPLPDIDFSDLVPKQPKKKNLNPSDFPDQPQKGREYLSTDPNAGLKPTPAPPR
jgi:hypothetical protein